MQEVQSVLEFAGSAVIERINFELARVIENIQNRNTDDKPRKLVVEMEITPINNRSNVNVKTTVKKVLRPTSAVHAQIAVAIIDGNYQLVESGAGYIDGQTDVFGEVHHVNCLKIKKSEEEDG